MMIEENFCSLANGVLLCVCVSNVEQKPPAPGSKVKPFDED